MKKVISAILVLMMIFGMSVLPAQALPNDEDKTVKILAIGNSYSNNAVEYISRIADSMGFKVSVTSLYDDGCSLERHVKSYRSNAREYEFYVDGANMSAPKKNTMLEAFERDDYDYITLQQSPSGAPNFSTYWTEQNPWLTDLYDIIKKHEPQAEVMIHQTWSFSELHATTGTQWSSIVYENSLEMFKKIENSYEKAADKLGIDKEKGIIPAGKAIQLAKDEYGYGDFYNESGDCLNGALYKDNVNHLNERGKYIAACVWIEKIFGADCRKATYYNRTLTKDGCEILRQIAHEAVTGEVQCVKENWRYLPEEDGIKLVHYMGEVPADGTIEIPVSVDGKTVKTVDDTAFKYIEGIKKVILPNQTIKYEKGALDKIATVEDLRKQKGGDKEEGNNILLIIIISVAVLIVAAVLLLLKFAVLKKKKTE